MASVPVNERTRELLKRLQEAVERETGQAVSQEEVLERLVTREFESREAFAESFRKPAKRDDEWEGLSDEGIEQWLSGTSASGNPVAEDEIDRVLYAEEACPDAEDE